MIRTRACRTLDFGSYGRDRTPEAIPNHKRLKHPSAVIGAGSRDRCAGRRFGGGAAPTLGRFSALIRLKLDQGSYGPRERLTAQRMKPERTGEAGSALGRDSDAGASPGVPLAMGDSIETLGRRAPVTDHRDAVNQLFRQHNRALVSFLLARLRSEQEARDVAQEAYVRLLQLDRPGAISFLRGYLFRIAANLSIDRLRHRVIREQVTVELFEELSDEGKVEPRR